MRKVLIVPVLATMLAAAGASVGLGDSALAQSTQQDLHNAMKGEAFAYLKYTMYAEQARKNGRADLAALFERTAVVERDEHFREHAKLLGLIKGDEENLKDAIIGENNEAAQMYPEMARRARATGDWKAAEHFAEVGRDEAKHRNAYGAQLGKGVAKENAMKFEIPKPMKIEHDELHADLVNATAAGGQTAEAARAVAKVLHDHFTKEEEYALPPLGLLVSLSQGKFESEMAQVLKLTDKLEAELPTMLAEHKEIVAALTRLTAAANAENKPDIVHFAEKLMLHAEAEEQISYPTTLLIGRYVKVKLGA